MAKRKVDSEITPGEEQLNEAVETAENAKTAESNTEEHAENLENICTQPAEDISKLPAEIKLETSNPSEGLAPAASKEEIGAAIQEKLSRKTDKDGADPFVPSVQLENEVKEIASKNGFPLSRGTEIGARLMARSKRIK